MTDSTVPADSSRRTALALTSAVGAVGCVAAAVPFVASFAPSERAKAAGAPVEVDLTEIAPGHLKSVAWRGKPVWILHRTPEMLESLKITESEVADPRSLLTAFPTPEWAQNQWRSIKPEYLVVIGICTHLGCVPIEKLQGSNDPSLPANWPGGFLCPCHGSTFDLSGRVFKNKPAPDNLEVPPYMYLSDTRIEIGVHEKA